jgi:hypothetical protein
MVALDRELRRLQMLLCAKIGVAIERWLKLL